MLIQADVCASQTWSLVWNKALFRHLHENRNRKNGDRLTSGLFPNVIGFLWPCKPNKMSPCCTTLALPPLLHCSVISNLIPYFYVCSFQIFIIFNLYSKSVHLPVWDKSDILFPSSSSIRVVLVICCTSHFPCCHTSDLLIWMHSKLCLKLIMKFYFSDSPLNPPPFSIFLGVEMNKQHLNKQMKRTSASNCVGTGGKENQDPNLNALIAREWCHLRL